MKQPDHSLPPTWTSAVQPKTLFVTEGNPVAVLISTRSGKRRTSTRSFAAAEAALAWCRAGGVLMVYCPAVAVGN